MNMDDSRSSVPSTSSSLKPEHMEPFRFDMVCRPIKSLRDVRVFLKDPPIWRSLCIDLNPHSEYAVRNMDIVRQNHAREDIVIDRERPQTFCHADLDSEEVPRHRRDDLPKTLVCHDMANGYHDDSNIDGTGNADAYTFYNWAVVDIFCYFSHHFITIPPLGWINTGHLHGVKVIGTVITEWAEGAEIWAQILASHEEWTGFAHALVQIAKMLNFDGWLLNIENKVDRPGTLLQFVRYLHALMHRELPHAALIWYDSVTVDGELHWQNGLNSRNKAFFDACDGIFTNYSWGEADVRAGAARASARLRDVYVGVDVWGRNFIGGGHFNTQQAVEIVHRHGCSLAVFAPAWTHEAAADREAFALRERALWGSLWPFLHTKLPARLPLQTSFCRGQGSKRWSYGEVLAPSPWFNLRLQQYQPSAAHGPHGYRLALEPEDGAVRAANEQEPVTPGRTAVIAGSQASAPDSSAVDLSSEKAVEQVGGHRDKVRYALVPVPGEPECLAAYYEDSFTGGSCLAINPCASLVRLLHCDIRVDGALVACVVTKTLSDGHLDVVVLASTERGCVRAILAGRGGGGSAAARAPLSLAGREFEQLRRHLLVNEPGFYVAVENAHGWKVRYYSLPLRGRVTAVSARAAGGRALLGYLGLTQVRSH